jgi:selenocysteine-specific elongation factor
MVSVAEVARLSRLTEAEARSQLADAFEALDADRVAPRATIAAARAAYLEALARAHHLAPARTGAPVGAIRGALTGLVSGDLVAHVERGLAADGSIRLAGSLVAMSDHDPFAALSAAQLSRLERIEADLLGGGVSPTDPARLVGQEDGDVDLLKLLVDTGRAVSLRNVALRQTVVFHRDALRAAHASLRAAFPPGVAFATGEARAALGTSRKFIVPLLEHFDAIGLTARDGDRRGIVDKA